MKAVIMTAPAVDGSTTSVADIDEPQPGPGQVAIDVAYAGVNFIDIIGPQRRSGLRLRLAVRPGPGVAGIIRSVGRALGGGRRIGTVGRPDKIAAGLAAGWDDVFAREAGLAEGCPEGCSRRRRRHHPGPRRHCPAGSRPVDRGTRRAGDLVRQRRWRRSGATPADQPPHRRQRRRARVQHEPTQLDCPEGRGHRPGEGARDDRRHPDPAGAHDHRAVPIGRRDPRPARPARHPRPGRSSTCNPRHQGRHPRRPNAPKPKETPHPASRNAAPAHTHNLTLEAKELRGTQAR